MSGVTEVPAGAYALMDHRYTGHREGLAPAAKVMSTVISRPDPQTVITDTGQKAIGTDTGLPVAQDLAQRHEISTVASLSAEHCRILLDDGVESPVDLGDKVWLTPRDIGVCVNLYDSKSNKVIDPAVLRAEKGYTPAQGVEVQTLAGDATDNIPGVRVGPSGLRRTI